MLRNDVRVGWKSLQMGGRVDNGGMITCWMAMLHAVPWIRITTYLCIIYTLNLGLKIDVSV